MFGFTLNAAGFEPGLALAYSMMAAADEHRSADDEIDPLDAFMMGVTAEVEKYNPKPTVSSKEASMQGASKPPTISDTEMTDDEQAPGAKHPEPNFETVDDLLAYGFIFLERLFCL